jgi:hypothetical protein
LALQVSRSHPPIVVTGHNEHASKRRRIPSLALASILLAIGIAGHLATSFTAQLTPLVSRSSLRFGDEMLLKVAFVLLLAWLLGVVGLYRIGDLVHVLLLVALMLLLLGTLKARDAAVTRGRGDSSGPS